MRRRDILILLGVVLMSPLRAASGKAWRIGFITANTQKAARKSVQDAFVQGVRQLGHTEGQDFIIDDVFYDYFSGKPDEAAHEMVQHHVDLIVATGQSDVVLAAKRATSDIPIVFVIAGDPVADGIVASMSRPGGNATGLTSLNAAVNAKRLELLKARCQRFGV
jgi:putative ABC transport system substrate-binding protein